MEHHRPLAKGCALLGGALRQSTASEAHAAHRLWCQSPKVSPLLRVVMGFVPCVQRRGRVEVEFVVVFCVQTQVNKGLKARTIET